MHTLLNLLSHYPILTRLASWLSTLDLLHISLTCHECYNRILGSKPIFTRLKRTALCDGRGLTQRQNFSGLYSVGRNYSYIWGTERKIWQDEPVEVKLYATKCDEAGALPCLKCGINVCEECRYCPREPMRDPLRRRPHLNESYQCENVFCLCTICDAILESSLNRQHLSALCDCDVYKRWICSKCVVREQKETHEMMRQNVVPEERWGELFYETKRLADHQSEMLFICPCGALIPDDIRERCTWCKRRHRGASEVSDEGFEVYWMPEEPNDGCYPHYTGDIYAKSMVAPYPKLGYDGRIWQVSE